MQFKLVHQLFFLAGILIFAASCKKAETNGVVYTKTVSDHEKRAAMELMNNMPDVIYYDQVHDKAYKFDIQNRDFSFATPNDGWNFSGPTGEIIYAEDGSYVVITSPQFGSNSGGGTIIAGNSALDIDYTFCFSASDEALGLDLFDFGGEISGVSTVIGIGGDFEALMDGDVDEDADFTDFFHGFAAYIVYANEAQGTYEVLNWLNDLDEDPDFLDDKGFGYVFDFQNEGLYFSSDGTLSVQGGDITFNGEYLAITDFILSFGEDEDEDISFDYVSGYGTLGCN